MKYFKLGWLLLTGLVFSHLCCAQSVQSLGSIAENVTGVFESVTRLITAGASVSGACMSMVAIFQFKQHKENPTQVPLSKPIMLLVLGSALLFFPTMVQVTQHSIFGEGAITAGPHGILIQA